MRTLSRVSTIYLRACLVIAALASCSEGTLAQLYAPVDLNKSIFTESNMKRLCVTSGDQQVVSRATLAHRLLDEANAFDSLDQELRLLRRASPDGQPAAGEPTSENVIYFVSSSTPFGINREYTKEEEDVRKRQMPVLLSFLMWLDGQYARNENYKVVGGSLPGDPERYFQKESPYEIVCTGKKTGGAPGGAGGADRKGSGEAKGDAVSGSLTKNIVVRKAVADIAVASTKLKDANGAQFSYKDDGIKDKQTISVEGLVGFVIAGTGADRAQELTPRVSLHEPRDLYWFKVVPYAYYKNVTQNPRAKTDIDYVSPGVTGNLTFADKSGLFSFDSQFEGSATLDQEHNSSVYNIGLRFSPSFYDGRNVIFGAPLPIGPFAVRPDLALVAREYVIGSQGTNSDLAGVSSYTGLGYDAEVQVFLGTEDSLISNFVGKAAYIYRYNTNGVVDVNRFTAGLSYALNKNFTVDLDYTRGRDVNTLQDQDLWTAGLSFRN